MPLPIPVKYGSKPVPYGARVSAVTRAAVLFALLAWAAVPAVAQLPPDEPWRTFDTPNFRVHFTPDLEEAARRAAYDAENAHRRLRAEFVPAPRRRIDLVVTDHVDYANGYATPFPTNRIVVFTYPPLDEPSLSFFDDWLELVVTHELVHIFHLDHVGGVWKGLRRVFGRSPLLFPQAYNNPRWVTEGLATYWESRLTGAGRVRGTYFDMVLRTALLEDEFFSIDRVTGNPARWPGGYGAYIYGSHFLAHLAERFGPEQVTEYVRQLGRQLLPYRADREARDAFGVSFSRGWRAWQDTLRTQYRAQVEPLRAAGLTEPEVLTEAGYRAAYPRYGPGGVAIAYAASTGREPTQTRVIWPEGREARIAERNTVGPNAWLSDGALLISQLERHDPYRVYADLYRVTTGGEETTLTRGARVREPSVHPDGARVVAVQSAGASNTLAIVDLRTGATRRLRAPSPDVHWSAPRWSPRGDQIAVARWRQGAFFDIVVLDTTGTTIREITRDRAVDDTPAWSPDGRYVVWSSDRTGIPNLYAHDLQTNRTFQVTNVLTGAFQPDVSPDGQWIAFQYYQADGFHIARIPWDPATWRPAPPVRREVLAATAETVPRVPAVGGPARPYSPWPSVAPDGWTPLVAGDSTLGLGFGALVFGEDVIGLHAYFATALLYTRRARFEGSLEYQYRGLENPLLNLQAAQSWNTVQDGIVRQERSIAASATAVRPRFRSLAFLSGGVELEDRRFATASRGDTLPTRFVDEPPDLGAFATAGFSSVRSFPFSISPEAGWGASATLGGHRYTRAYPGLERPTGYLEMIGRARAYPAFQGWGFARHVVALRLAGAARTGARTPLFFAGGTGGEIESPLDIGSPGRSVSFPIRGYAEGAQAGDRAFVASAEYRFPLALVERGYRLFPLFLDRFWGDVFTDVGGAYCATTCRSRFAPERPTPLISVGAELGVDLTTGYLGSVPLRAGFAVPLSNVGQAGAEQRPRPSFYIAAGRAF